MAENIQISPAGTGKRERYEQLLPQLEALVLGEPDQLANLSNLIAGIHHAMGFLWTGVYFVKGEELVLGPFQGPVACTRIAKGKGVCGTAWEQKRVIVVDDVDQFPGHIACSSLSRSEIVLPAFKDGKVWLVLDADSASLSCFDETDAEFLSKVISIIEKL
jgi:L-methionine (R)-S-oxide reductase